MTKPSMSSFTQRCALVLLNQPLKPMTKIFKCLWQKAIFKVFVDGAANEVYSNLPRESFLPDAITGDFDSIQHEVMEYYKQKNVEIIHTPDQDETDFTKALKIVVERIKSLEVDRIVVLVKFQGRIDQQFANFNTLYEARKYGWQVPIYIMSDTNLTCLLTTGKNIIEVNSKFKGQYCGLIPLGCACNNVITSGLKWNLDNQALEFGHLVSTSNTYDESKDSVLVETDKPLIWCMTIEF